MFTTTHWLIPSTAAVSRVIITTTTITTLLKHEECQYGKEGNKETNWEIIVVIEVPLITDVVLRCVGGWRWHNAGKGVPFLLLYGYGIERVLGVSASGPKVFGVRIPRCRLKEK